VIILGPAVDPQYGETVTIVKELPNPWYSFSETAGELVINIDAINEQAGATAETQTVKLELLDDNIYNQQISSYTFNF
jgi:hypothetical protein